MITCNDTPCSSSLSIISNVDITLVIAIRKCTVIISNIPRSEIVLICLSIQYREFNCCILVRFESGVYILTSSCFNIFQSSISVESCFRACLKSTASRVSIENFIDCIIHSNITITVSNSWNIISSPISAQLQTARAGRNAPVIQIAGKEAGAIHSGSVILSFEP